jgi:hypothetical protein
MAAKNSVTLRLGTEGAEQVTAKLREIGETASREFTRTSREAQQASRGFETLERRLDPLVKANHDLAQAQTAAARAVEAGVRSHQDAARVIDLAAERHRRLTQGLGDNAKATALARHEWVNLGRQMTDVGTSLAGGASPFMVLTQQGGQIADVFTSSRGGAAAAMKEFGGAILSFALNPATLLAGTIATLAVGAHSAAGRLAEMADAAKISGLEVNTLMGGRVIGARVGLDAEKSQGALTNAAQEFEAFKRNEGAIKQMLEKLGGDFLGVADKARTAGQFIDAIGGIIRNLPVTEGRDLAEKLFGKDAGARFFSSLRDGSISMASLATASGDAENKLGAVAREALKMRHEIEEAHAAADTKLLKAFGRLADPITQLSLIWANVKSAIVDATLAVGDFVETISLGRIRNDLRDAVSGVSGVSRAGVGGMAPVGLRAGMTTAEQNALLRNNRIGGLTPISPLIPANARDLRGRLEDGSFSPPNINTLSDGETAGESRARYVTRDEKPMKAPKAARLPHISSSRAARDKRDPLADMISGLEDERALAQADLSTATATNAEREKARALVSAENVARREGVELSRAQREQIEAVVGATEKARTSAELLAASSREVLDTTRDIARETLGGVVGALRQGKDMGEALAAVLDRVLGKLLNLATDRTIDVLLGKSGSIGGGVFGGGIASLFSGLSPFASGGIMTGAGPVPLRRYASGGVANSPQLAMFGEGSRPEAYVPLPDGRRIPVALQNAAGAAKMAAGGALPRMTFIDQSTGVTVTPRMSDGEVFMLIENRIAASEKRTPGALASAQARAW